MKSKSVKSSPEKATDERAEELARQAKVIKRRRGVPYKELAQAKQIGEARFPKADEVTARLYSGAPYIEVWNEGAALIYFVDLDENQVIERATDQATKAPRRRRP